MYSLAKVLHHFDLQAVLVFKLRATLLLLCHSSQIMESIALEDFPWL